LANIFGRSLGHVMQDEGSFYSLSTEYLSAARILINTPPITTNYSSVIYYLLGHAAELSLKSFLYKDGESIKSLMEVGHNLSCLIELAQGKGLNINGLESIFELSRVYKDKGLEYRKLRNTYFPPQSQLLKDVEELQQAVFSRVAKL
jgi:hypothetical protein